MRGCIGLCGAILTLMGHRIRFSPLGTVFWGDVETSNFRPLSTSFDHHIPPEPEKRPKIVENRGKMAFLDAPAVRKQVLLPLGVETHEVVAITPSLDS